MLLRRWRRCGERMMKRPVWKMAVRETLMCRLHRPSRGSEGSLRDTASPKVSNSVFAVKGDKWKQTGNACLICSTAHSGKNISGAFAVIFVTYGICWLKPDSSELIVFENSGHLTHTERSSLRYLGCHSKISRELSAWNSIKAEELNQHCQSLGWRLQNSWMF